MEGVILLVDDVPLNRVVLRRTLELAGAACVAEACNGQAAFEAYRAGGGRATYSLVLMDCQMPLMDGWAATQHIRELEQAAGWAPVPVIAVTTEDLSPGSPALQRCWDCGMTAATGKPLSQEAATQLLQQWANLPPLPAGQPGEPWCPAALDSSNSVSCASRLREGCPMGSGSSSASGDAQGADGSEASVHIGGAAPAWHKQAGGSPGSRRGSADDGPASLPARLGRLLRGSRHGSSAGR